MKKIINGRKYDTTTAKEVGHWSNNHYYMDLYYTGETLYKKKTGEFFLYCEGGAGSKYGTVLGSNSWGSGERIYPLTESQARSWSEEHMNADDYEEVFGVVEE